MFLRDNQPDAANKLANPIWTKPITMGDSLCPDAASKYPNAESIERQPIIIVNIDKAFMSFLNLTVEYTSRDARLTTVYFFDCCSLLTWRVQPSLSFLS